MKPFHCALLAASLLAEGQASAQVSKPPPAEKAVAGLYDLDAIEVAPRVINRGEAQRAAREVFALELRPGGGSGSVTVRFRVEVDGTASHLTIPDSGVDPRVERAAFAVVRTMRFSPALVNRRPVVVLIEVPLTYDVPTVNAPRDTTATPKR